MKRRDLTALATMANSNHVIMIAIAVIFLGLILRNGGLYAVVFGDELIYSRLSRHSEFSEANIPSYVYFWLFRYTNYCGEGFLDCARILNALFFVLAIPFIYQLARRVTSNGVAAFVAITSSLGPFNTYTAYFMPEAMYYFGFWLFSWFFLTFRDLKPIYYGSIAGLILGVMTMIKVHAVFMVSGLVLFVAYSESQRMSCQSGWVRRTVSIIASLVIVAMATRLLLGYLLAGEGGWNIFGSFYGAYAGSAVDVGHYFGLALKALQNFQGHLMAVSILFGVPLASAMLWRSNKATEGVARNNLFSIQVYVFGILASILIVVALFTASVAGAGNQTIDRLHMRYYNFMFPFFFIIAGSQIVEREHGDSLRRLLPPAVLVASLAVYSMMSLSSSFSPGFVDSPELRGVTYSRSVFYIIGGLGLAALAVWAFDRRMGGGIFIFVLMPFTLLASSYYVNGELRQRLRTDVYDDAGIITRRYLGADASKVTVVGSDQLLLYRTLFYIDSADSREKALVDGAEITTEDIATGTSWLVVIGDYKLPNQFSRRLSFGGFVIARADGADVIDFRTGSWPGVIGRKRGLASPEDWGTWSDGADVVLDFVSPLPKEFIVRFKAMAFGPNTEKSFTMTIGGVRKTFGLLATPQEISLPFKIEGKDHTIRIEVPAPTTPKALGISEDTRHLGIGIVSLSIDPIPALTQ